MRYSQAEKYEIIRLVEDSKLGVKRTLKQLGIARSTFYSWYKRYLEYGYDGLKDHSSGPKKFWNKIPGNERKRIRDIALKHPEKTPRELAWYITDNEGYYVSESSVYRILREYNLMPSPAFIVISAADKFKNPTTRINEMWQTDFTYLLVTGWGWYYLSTVLDDYSRFIIAWKLFRSMRAQDVQDTLDMALEKSGVDKVMVYNRPKLLSDNGPCYKSQELADYIEQMDMKHVRGKPLHPQTQGKIERYHQTMKNTIKLHNYECVEDLEKALASFVDYYNYERYHESLDNMTPADVYYGNDYKIKKRREKIKKQTMKNRKNTNLKKTA